MIISILRIFLFYVSSKHDTRSLHVFWLWLKLFHNLHWRRKLLGFKESLFKNFLASGFGCLTSRCIWKHVMDINFRRITTFQEAIFLYHLSKISWRTAGPHVQKGEAVVGVTVVGISAVGSSLISLWPHRANCDPVLHTQLLGLAACLGVALGPPSMGSCPLRHVASWARLTLGFLCCPRFTWWAELVPHCRSCWNWRDFMPSSNERAVWRGVCLYFFGNDSVYYYKFQY